MKRHILAAALVGAMSFLPPTAYAHKTKTVPFNISCGLCTPKANLYAGLIRGGLLRDPRFREADSHDKEPAVLELHVNPLVPDNPEDDKFIVTATKNGEIITEVTEICDKDSIVLCVRHFIDDLNLFLKGDEGEGSYF